MTYIGKRYIGTAWDSEMRHHERTVGQLRIKMEKLAKELSWELQQHHTRLQELQLLETPLNKESVFDQVALKRELGEESHSKYFEEEETLSKCLCGSSLRRTRISQLASSFPYCTSRDSCEGRTLIPRIPLARTLTFQVTFYLDNNIIILL